jgi:hypothetical protein
MHETPHDRIRWPVHGFDKLRRVTESHAADALLSPNATNQCVSQKKLDDFKAAIAAPRVLQFRENEHRDSMHFGDNRRRRQFRADGAQFGRDD